MKSKKFVHPDSNGIPWLIVSTEQLWANVYAIKYNKPEVVPSAEIWMDLLHQAKAEAIQLGASSIECRIRLDYQPDLLRQQFDLMGFKHKFRRVEFESDVKALPEAKGSPLRWKTAKQLNWDLNQLALYTKAITTDALDVDPSEKAEDFIQDWITNSDLSSGLDCISIGFINDHPCALVVAQVNQPTGWSRISYMGLLPAFRRKNLGKWVHKQGFSMMKAQGGRTYHGGTLAHNLPMRKLFESHNCRFLWEMEEWTCLVGESKI